MPRDGELVELCRSLSPTPCRNVLPEAFAHCIPECTQSVAAVGVDSFLLLNHITAAFCLTRIFKYHINHYKFILCHYVVFYVMCTFFLRRLTLIKLELFIMMSKAAAKERKEVAVSVFLDQLSLPGL